jgi:Regulator of ribonuclease activity B
MYPEARAATWQAVAAMPVQFAMVLPSPEDGRAAAETLRAAGYEVDVRRNDDGSCVLSALGEVTVSAIAETRAWMEALADQYSGDFLGHGGISGHGLRR